MLPRVALVDPELTYVLPPPLTATTGLDALTQLIEPFVCTRANPFTDGLCEEGMIRVASALRLAFSGGAFPGPPSTVPPDVAAARENMAVASLFGGLGLANAGLGAVHGIAGPLGGMIDAPHGALCASLLPTVVEANLRALRERAPQSPALPRYRRVARLLTGDPDAIADDAVAWLRRLVTDLGIPGLSAHGVGAELVPDLVVNAARASSMKANPVKLTREELTAIVEAAL